MKEDVRNLEHAEANAYRVRPCQTLPFPSKLEMVPSRDLPSRRALASYPCGKPEGAYTACRFIRWWANEIWQVNPRG